MKLAFVQTRAGRLSPAAFTITEMMVTIAIFSFVMAGTIAFQVFGLRTYTLAATKLSAATSARETLNAMRDQIRSASVVLVGTYSETNGGGFTQISNGLPQIGSALAIQFTNATSTNYTFFYKDSTNVDNTVCSVNNGAVTILAKYVTNSLCFQAEDYQGNILTNYQNNPVIRITLQFYQWEYPVGVIGTNGINAYDFYQLRTRITRRAK